MSFLGDLISSLIWFISFYLLNEDGIKPWWYIVYQIGLALYPVLWVPLETCHLKEFFLCDTQNFKLHGMADLESLVN